MSLSKEVIQECKRRLLSMKEDLLNRVRAAHLDLTAADKMTGDEIDQSVAQLTENAFLANQERLRHQLFEIENALARIEMNTFGICEETQEPIETERLMAIPYTRLSIEGAEMREALTKKFARF
jgi:DnaK suppressor protein